MFRNKPNSFIRKYSRLFSGLDSSGMWRVLRASDCVADVQIDVNELNYLFAGQHSHNYNRNLKSFMKNSDSFDFRGITESVVLVSMDYNICDSWNYCFPYCFYYLLNCILRTVARVVSVPKNAYGADFYSFC